MGHQMSRLLQDMTSMLSRLLPCVLLNAVRLRAQGRPLVVALGFSAWKEGFVRRFFADRAVLFVDSPLALKLVARLFKRCDVDYAIWSFRDEALGLDLAVCSGHAVWHVEDGFIRSVGRGLDHVPPWSLCLDRGAYFDASRPSDLEQMLNRFKPGDLSDAERATARQLMETLKALRIDKYNLVSTNPASTSAPDDLLSIPADAILVLGQVEDDFSILRNSNAISTNAGLLQRAMDENPGRPIFFKQHPDCVGIRKRPGYVALDAFGGVREIPPSMPVAEAINSVETVYTISSLGGFEALMRGKKVITFGAPFYAGWGLTTDHVSFPRRQNRLALDDLFYVAYVVYPHYFDPHDGTRLEAGDVVRKMVDLRAS